jgi:hypothetical protein
MQSSLLDRVRGVTSNSERHAKFHLGRLQQPPTESTTRLTSPDDTQTSEETKSPKPLEQGAAECKNETSDNDDAGGPQRPPAPNEGITPSLDELQHGPDDEAGDGTSGSGIVSGWKLAAILIGLSLAVFCMSLVRPGFDHILSIHDVP